MRDELKKIRELSKQEVEDKDIWAYAKEVAGILGFKYFDLLKGEDGCFFVVPRDWRFNDLEEICEKYAGVIEIPDSEKLLLEKKLYRIIMALTKEERITGEFTLQPLRDIELQKLTSTAERLAKLLEILERRVSGLEKLAGRIPR